ncbi:MAG: hypothetical protein OXR73_21195 [Myxococcales bacterium]|nr:hypothetical protein [Myxococcales bacterium]
MPIHPLRDEMELAMDLCEVRKRGSMPAALAWVIVLAACGSSDDATTGAEQPSAGAATTMDGAAGSMPTAGTGAATMGGPQARAALPPASSAMTGGDDDEQAPATGTASLPSTASPPSAGSPLPMEGAQTEGSGDNGGEAPTGMPNAETPDGEGGTEPAGDDGAAPVSQAAPGGWPRDAEVDVNQMGPYAYESYTEGLDNRTYSSSVMYYPTDAPEPFASVVFSPGFTATKEQYKDFLGPLLASHGIAILLTTPTTTGDFPQQRSTDLQAAFEQIATENERSGGPLAGKLAPDRVCVTGHSMGGGGSLWAAAELGDKIRCAMPLQAWQPGTSFRSIVAPTMFIAAENDTIAGNSSNSRLFYNSLSDSVEKYYVEFGGASHFLTSNSRGSHYDVQSRYMIAFYKLYLEDDERYREILDAAADPALSEYLH